MVEIVPLRLYHHLFEPVLEELLPKEEMKITK